MIIFWYVSEETFEFLISGFLLVEFIVCVFWYIGEEKVEAGKKNRI